jgi:hypothetical protein
MSDNPYPVPASSDPENPFQDSKPNGSANAPALDPSQFLGKKSTATPAAATKTASLNPDAFLTQSVAAASAGATKTAGNVGIIDGKRTYFRTRAGEDYHRFGIDALYPDGSDVTKALLISPDFELPAAFAEYVKPSNLFLVHDHKGHTGFTIFPDSTNSWHVSRYEICIEAELVWVKLRSDRPSNEYQPAYPPLNSVLYHTEPLWPEASFAELFSICFKDRIIRSADDPALAIMAGLSYGGSKS